MKKFKLLLLAVLFTGMAVLSACGGDCGDAKDTKDAKDEQKQEVVDPNQDLDTEKDDGAVGR